MRDVRASGYKLTKRAEEATRLVCATFAKGASRFNVKAVCLSSKHVWSHLGLASVKQALCVVAVA